MEPTALGEGGNGQPTQEAIAPKPSQGVSPEILSALGLSAEDLEGQKNALRDETLKVIRQNGKDYYKNFNPQDTTIKFITDEQVRTIYNRDNVYGDRLNVKQSVVEKNLPSNLPATILRAYEGRSGDMGRSFEGTENAKRGEVYTESPYDRDNARNFVEGFGSAALEASDWNTAINAFDITTPGGVIQNEEAIAKMKELPIEDKIKIATQIQKAANDRNEGRGTAVGALAPLVTQAA